MKHGFTQNKRWSGSVLWAALLLGTLSGAAALSQPPPDGPPHGGPGGFGHGPGGPGMRGGRQLTVVTIPAAALTAGLKLTDDQAAKISAIQDAVKTQRDTLMPRPAEGQAPPDRETMQANFDKLRSGEAKAKADIEALLTDSQTAKLPAFLKEMSLLQRAGIPAEVYAELKLTTDQKSQIASLVKQAQANAPAPPPRDGSGDGPPPPMGGGRGGRGGPGGLDKATRDKVMAVLTSDQQQILKDWMEAHPRPQRGGGPGGRGGRGGQGGDFGPPPHFGGQDGPGEAPPPPSE